MTNMLRCFHCPCPYSLRVWNSCSHPLWSYGTFYLYMLYVHVTSTFDRSTPTLTSTVALLIYSIIIADFVAPSLGNWCRCGTRFVPHSLVLRLEVSTVCVSSLKDAEWSLRTYFESANRPLLSTRTNKWLIATGIFFERNDVILDVDRCPRPCDC